MQIGAWLAFVILAAVVSGAAALGRRWPGASPLTGPVQPPLAK